MSLAKISGLFRLTRDAELAYSGSGMPILKLGLVNSEKYKDKETTLFIDGTAFSKPAEIINQYAGTKGTQIYLTGKLQTDMWDDANGQKRSKISMIIETFDFVSSRDNTQQQPQGQQGQSYSQPQQNAQPQYQPQQNQQMGQQQAYQQPIAQPQQQGQAVGQQQITIDESQIF